MVDQNTVLFLLLEKGSLPRMKIFQIAIKHRRSLSYGSRMLRNVWIVTCSVWSVGYFGIAVVHGVEEVLF